MCLYILYFFDRHFPVRCHTFGISSQIPKFYKQFFLCGWYSSYLHVKFYIFKQLLRINEQNYLCLNIVPSNFIRFIGVVVVHWIYHDILKNGPEFIFICCCCYSNCKFYYENNQQTYRILQENKNVIIFSVV